MPEFWLASECGEGLGRATEGFTPYNARHTGISWAVDKGVDLQKSVSARDTAASRLRPDMPPSSMNAIPASQMLSRKSLTVRALQSAATRLRQSRPEFPRQCRRGRAPGTDRVARCQVTSSVLSTAHTPSDMVVPPQVRRLITSHSYIVGHRQPP